MFLSGMVGTASGGSEKKYKITDNSGCSSVQNIASPGESVNVISDNSSINIKGKSGNWIPYRTGASLTRVATGQHFYFIMPAEDVTIS